MRHLSPLLIDLPAQLTTQRLVLRSPRAGDGPAVNEAVLESWDALHRWMPWARQRPTAAESEEAVRHMASEVLARRDLPMFLFLEDGQTFVGASGLVRMDWSVPRFEVGYWVRRTYEGQGYVSEAVKELTRFAFDGLGAARVEIHCSHRNLRSQRVAEACGFALEGKLRHHGREPDGSLRDTFLYARVLEGSGA